MSHRKVRAVMTADVVTARTDTPFKELARRLAPRRVSALPVLDADGNLAGMVSEADLLAKQAFQEDPNARPLPWWRRWLARDRTAGTTASDVMTSPAVTIGPAESVVAAARLMERHKIKRLPVTGADGKLVGIVSRGDLVRVFLRPDPEIRDEIIGDVFTDFLGTNPALVRVEVIEGVVTLGGEVGKKSMIPFAVHMSRSVDGVVDVIAGLSYAEDDTRQPPVPDLTSY